MPYQLHASLGRRGLVGCLFGLAAVGAVSQTAPLHFYMLGASQFNTDFAARTASFFKLQGMTQTQFKGSIYQMGDGSVRGLFAYGIGTGGAFIDVLPDLRNEHMPLPATLTQLQIAGNFAHGHGFFPVDKFMSYRYMIDTWANSNNSVTGGQTKPTDVIRSIRYYRMLDGLPVYGPSSNAWVFVDANGVVGCGNNLRPITMSPLTPMMKTPTQINNEVNLNVQMYHLSYVPAVQRRMIYIEQGETFLQPALLCDVQFTDRTKQGETEANYFIVPLTTNCPEFVHPMCMDVGPPIFPDGKPTTGLPESASDSLLASLNPAPAAQANPVQVGEYIVQNDHPCWLNDANAFWGSMSFWNTITGHPHANRRDYWWDMPYCWEAWNGYSDSSPAYVGSDHFVLIEGHGAPWLCTCYQNNADVIHLNVSPGYGTFARTGEVTAYIVWQSCDVIPEPGHAFDGDFQSGTAWDVWWRVFKGMRANFGYRTLMHICNGVGGIFGVYAGIGCQNTSAWLSATDQGVFNHSNGWDYGSTVLVTGHEGDTIYNNSQLSPPGSLTMWWIHA